MATPNQPPAGDLRHSPSSSHIFPHQFYYIPPPSVLPPADPSPFPPPTSAPSDVDLLLAQSGYNVKAADLPLLAERIEQLEALLGAQDPVDLPAFPSDAVLYNPSDMASWLENLLGELAPPTAASGFGSIFSGSSSSDAFHDVIPISQPQPDFYGVGGAIPAPMDVDSAAIGCPWDTAPPDPAEFLEYSRNRLLPDHDDDDENLPRDCHYALTEDRVSSTSGRQTLGASPPFEQPSRAAQIDQIPTISASDPPAKRRPVTDSSRASGSQPPEPQEVNMEPAAPAAADNVNRRRKDALRAAAAYQQPEANAGRGKHGARQRQTATIVAPSPSSGASNVYSRDYDGDPSDGIDVKAPRKKRKNGGSGPSPAGITGGEPEVMQQDMERKTAQKASVVGGNVNGVRPVPPAVVAAAAAAAVEGSVSDCRSTTEEADDDETGITLVHLLMACADAIQKNEMGVASEMVRNIDKLASSNRGAMGRVAKHFVAALDQRLRQQRGGVAVAAPPQFDPTDVAYAQFYDAGPYLKFSHFMANQAILEAFEGKKVVHVIDFNVMQGSQWPPLIHALALRNGGPPKLRLTGIGAPPPPPDDGGGKPDEEERQRDVLAEVGRKLAEVAKMCKVEFSFQGVVAERLEDVMAKPALLDVRPGETVAVNAVLQLHRLLHSNAAPLRRLLAFVRRLSPAVFTVVEQHANHNSAIFLERFVEALHYYCTMFDSLDAAAAPDLAYAEHYLGREIVNIVACEGAARVERHEPLQRWRQRLQEAGFRPRHLGSNAFAQASMLVNWCSGEGYAVQENGGCLTLGWHSWPLIAASAWQCSVG